MMARAVHFLESSDSVRSGVSLRDGAVSLPTTSQEEAVDQLLLETLLTLSLGRDVVLTQSAVLDSYAAQRLIAVVRSAQLLVARGDPSYWLTRERPLRVHLHGADTFAEAARRVLAGIAAGSWVSSLYPDLGPAPGEGHSEACDPASVGDYRSELFEETWAYFGKAARSDTRVVVSSQPVAGTWPSLDAAVRRLAGGPVRLDDDGTDAAGADVRARTRRALAALLASSPVATPFADRSRLHGDRPWHPQEPSSAADICGPDVVLVREAVDTIYNRVVFTSIGVASGSFTTCAGTVSGAAEGAMAQEFAFQSSNPGHGLGTSSSAAFEFRSDQRSLSEALELVQETFVPAVAEVLRARESERWRASLAAVDRAADRDGQARALERHCRLVAAALGSLGEAATTDSGGLRLRLRRMGVGLGATGAVDVTGIINPWVGLGVGLGVVAGSDVQAMWRHRNDVRGLRRSLGQIIGPPGGRRA